MEKPTSPPSEEPLLDDWDEEAITLLGRCLREGGHKEGAGPLEGLNSLPDGSLGKHLPLFLLFTSSLCV